MDRTDWSIRALLYSYNQHLGFTLDKTILNRIIMTIYTSNSFSNIFIRILSEYFPIPLPHLKRSFHPKNQNLLKKPTGVLPYQDVRGGLDLTSSLEAKFGARSGQVHQIRGKIWEVLLPQDPKVGKKSQFWGQIRR